MKTLTIFDPAMCCSTGICGAEIDQKLVDFAADLDWLKSEGTEVKRINLSQEPALFAENEQVKSILQSNQDQLITKTNEELTPLPQAHENIRGPKSFH